MRTTTVIFLLWAGLPLIGQAQGSRPTITRFAASPAKVLPGQPSTLSWSVIGATSLTMGSGSGAGAVAGTPVQGTSVKVAPATTQSYILTATNSFGTSMASVTVTAGRAPTITKFAATPVTVTAGQGSTLSWGVRGSRSLVMSPFVGGLAGTSARVTPTATQVYSLTATNTFGSVSAAVSVTVIPGSAPSIGRFTATPAKASPGQGSVLSWAVTGATGLTVQPGVGAVTGAAVKVAPSTTTSYTLTATNSFGSV